MFKFMRTLLTSFSIVILTSCSLYQPHSITGGYSDSYQGNNIYYISYKGNNYEDFNTVQDYALRRAASLTVAHQKRYFEILNAENDADKYQTYSAPTNASPSFYNENTSPPVIRTYNGTITTHYKAEAHMTIKILDNPTAHSNDAQAILAQVGPK